MAGESGLIDAAKYRIGVFGGAFVTGSAEVHELARQIGRSIIGRGHMVITGATSGLPHMAGKAAIEAGGIVLGISPAKSALEHVRVYAKPLDGCSYIFYTGQGYTGRNYLNLRNCDMAVFIGGESGTMEEYCIGIYEGLVLGALTNSGGICELLPVIVTRFQTEHGATCCFDTDPEALLDQMIWAHRVKHANAESGGAD
jgi:uncharacterized protein (TIGR00725 family)